MLSKDQLKVHAAVLMFIVHKQVKDLTGEEQKKRIDEVVDGLNPIFIFGILNLQVYQNLEESKKTTIPKQYRELSLFLHPDKLEGDIQYLGTPIFEKIKSHKDMSVDDFKVFIALNDPERVKEITEKFREKYNVSSDDGTLDQEFIKTSKLVRENPLVFSKVVSKIKTIKILLIVFFPLVVALLTAAIIVGTIFFALYRIFIKPFIDLINKYSSAKNGIDQEQGADEEWNSEEEQSLCSILCSHILQVFLWAILLPIIVALSPIITIIFAVYAIRFYQVLYDIFQPLVTAFNQKFICEKEVQQIKELVKTQEWKSFKEEHFSEITDDQVKEYIQALADLSKEKSPSSEVDSVSEVEPRVEGPQASKFEVLPPDELTGRPFFGGKNTYNSF